MPVSSASRNCAGGGRPPNACNYPPLPIRSSSRNCLLASQRVLRQPVSPMPVISSSQPETSPEQHTVKPEQRIRFSRSPPPRPGFAGYPAPAASEPPSSDTEGASGPLRPIRLSTARSAAPPLEPRLWEERPLYDRSIRIGCGFCTPQGIGGVRQISAGGWKGGLPMTWFEDERIWADQLFGSVAGRRNPRQAPRRLPAASIFLRLSARLLKPDFHIHGGGPAPCLHRSARRLRRRLWKNLETPPSWVYSLPAVRSRAL